MNFYFDIVVFCLATLLLLNSIKGLFTNKGSALDYCLVAFYLVHVIPIFMQLDYGIPEVLHHVNVGSAMEDNATDYIYGLTVLSVMWLLRYYSKKLIKRFGNTTIDTSSGSVIQHRSVRYLNKVVMFSPLIAVLFSPIPSLYLTFSPFYTSSYGIESHPYIYHSTVVNITVLLSLLAICLGYYNNKDNDKSLVYYIAIFLLTWIDGKRTIFLFSIVGVLASDLMHGRFSDTKYRKKQIVKTVLLVSIVLAYFVIYNAQTGKGEDTEFYFLYTFYFSRMSIVKTAIYDQLYTHSLLQYPLQTFIFNLFLFIPRAVWTTKPVMYCIYFTSYADGYGPTQQLDYNLQVNLWSEFISNAGIIFGPLLGVLFVYFIIKQSLATYSKPVLLLGIAFCLLYSVYGFEHIVSYMFFIWVAIVVLKKKKKPKIFKK